MNDIEYDRLENTIEKQKLIIEGLAAKAKRLEAIVTDQEMIIDQAHGTMAEMKTKAAEVSRILAGLRGEAS